MRLGTNNWMTAYHLRQRLRMLPDMFRARPMAAPAEAKRPVFIVGAGRSGTTLLRAMLMKTDRLCIPPESQALPAITANYKVYSFLPWEEVVKSVLGEFHTDPFFDMWDMDLAAAYRKARDLPEDRRSLAELIDLVFQQYCVEKHGRPVRWGDKTPYNCVALPSIHEVFPQAQFLHLVRDGRDCAVSIVDAKLCGDLPAAARLWTTSVSACRRFGAGLDSGAYMEVRYEDLVQRPEDTLNRVCAFLDLPFTERMLEFYQDADRLGDSALPHHTNLRRPLFATSIGKWRERLTEDEQGSIMAIMGRLLNELRYV